MDREVIPGAGSANSPVASASGAGLSTFKTSAPPINAPSSIAATESARRASLEPCPPASAESAATPVKVMVSTVVVRSGTASFLAAAWPYLGWVNAVWLTGDEKTIIPVIHDAGTLAPESVVYISNQMTGESRHFDNYAEPGALTADPVSGTFNGWIQATSATPGLTGFFLNANNAVTDVDGSGSGSPSADFILPIASADGQSQTELTILNVNSETATIAFNKPSTSVR